MGMPSVLYPSEKRKLSWILSFSPQPKLHAISQPVPRRAYLKYEGLRLGVERVLDAGSDPDASTPAPVAHEATARTLATSSP